MMVTQLNKKKKNVFHIISSLRKIDLYLYFNDFIISQRTQAQKRAIWQYKCCLMHLRNPL